MEREIRGKMRREKEKEKDKEKDRVFGGFNQFL